MTVTIVKGVTAVSGSAGGGGGSGTVTNIVTGAGLTGGPITNTGTISFVSIDPSSLWANVSTATAVPVITTLGAGLGFSGTTIINLSGGSAGITQISTGTGLTGGPVTSSGTVQFATIAAKSLWANVSNATLTPVVTTLGTGLAFSGSTLGLTANALIGSPGITFDGGGSVLTANTSGYVTMTYTGTFANWYLAADQSGSIVVDIKRLGTSIIGASGNAPTLASAQTGNAVISAWTSAGFSPADIIQFNVSSISTLTYCNLVFKANKTL